MKKLSGIVLIYLMMFAFTNQTNALTNYKVENWQTIMPQSECVAEESDCTGYNAGKATNPNKTNKTTIESNSYIGNKESNPNKWLGMKIGPYVYGNNTTIAQGINEELKIELGTDIIKPQEFFEISLSLKDNEGKYVNELNIFTENVGEEIYIGIQGIHINGGYFIKDPIAKISQRGIYTYSWNIQKNNGKSYVTFAIKDESGSLVGSSDAIEIDSTFKGPETQNIDTEVDEKLPIGAENVSVRWIWFCNIQVASGLNVYNDTEVIAQPSLTGEEDITVSENVSDILKESLSDTSDQELKELLTNHDVNVLLETKKVNEEELTKDDIKNFTSLIEGSSILDYFNLDIIVKADGIEDHYLKELNEPIEFTVALPEKLPAVEKGYTRTYYILRQHNGLVEKLETTLSNDGKNVSFQSDRFSTYALAYIDTKNSSINEKPEENPQTGDLIMGVISVGILSLCLLGCLTKVLKSNI